MTTCPFCGYYPYECVDVGFGCNYPVAVNCCEFGPMVFDDRTEDKRWTKLADRILDELDEVYGEDRMAMAHELFRKFHQPDAAPLPQEKK